MEHTLAWSVNEGRIEGKKREKRENQKSETAFCRTKRPYKRGQNRCATAAKVAAVRQRSLLIGQGSGALKLTI